MMLVAGLLCAVTITPKAAADGGQLAVARQKLKHVVIIMQENQAARRNGIPHCGGNPELLDLCQRIYAAGPSVRGGGFRQHFVAPLFDIGMERLVH
jgi:hypothetical protein